MSIRMRHTRGHTNNRRSHHALVATNVITDKESGALRLPHRLDETTGMYRGKQIAAPKAVKVKTREAKAALPAPEVAHTHDHDHEHAHAEHDNAEVKAVEAKSKKATHSRAEHGK